MAGSEGNRYFDIFLNFEIWLENRKAEVIVNKLCLELLGHIKKMGSIASAAEACGISYRNAWGNLKDTEQRLGFTLVDKQRGGQTGGNTLLTTEGERLLDAYSALNEEIDLAVKGVVKRFFRSINDNE